VIGIDGSPTCGVAATLDLGKSFDLTAHLDVGKVTPERMNAIIRQSVIEGKGLFISLLQAELAKRRLAVPFDGLDLIAELDGGKLALRGLPSGVRSA
jgi:hypothetical protein